MIALQQLYTLQENIQIQNMYANSFYSLQNGERVYKALQNILLKNINFSCFKLSAFGTACGLSSLDIQFNELNKRVTMSR